MLEIIEITKHFGPVQALKGVTLTARPGSIHGIVGENGAGKSTLMKIVTGYQSRTDGTIRLDGQDMAMASPREAAESGIGMLYQEPLDFPQLSVLDNFIAGADAFEPDVQKAVLASLQVGFGFHLDPRQKMQELTVGERQQLELLRLIRNGARILILDEPTTGISTRQKSQLFSALKKLREDGATILLVSHKIDEIEQLCDEVTVLRAGLTVAWQQQPFDRRKLLSAMFDTVPQQNDTAPKVATSVPGKSVLVFDEVHSSVGRSGMKGITITIGAGEIVGLAGVDGSGQSVFLKAAYGLLAPEQGNVTTLGRIPGPEYGSTKNEKVFLPSDRLSEALFPGLSIREHHLLAGETPQFLARNSGISQTQQAIATASIRGSVNTQVEDLSGGNQQRLLLSLIPPQTQLILMENPTRGLDVQSAAWTWRYLRERLHPEGAIVFASPELEEILSQATRVLAFYNGKILLDKKTSETSQEEISLAITGQLNRP
ncbi:ATP-binding cassette domain-containing protein [Desulfopila aestuarii]|uniref:Simple sugar transport system ATP-binding protein n=1 Tax=Desulfopila aestuarii DSM 18488 TaxID=1121416 RepID=A0A1M7Y577_9BACT|nr:ATP-binding cassette domain-containing protein [Desulfopila aestuarii]SHO47563.1 simple sugar transport system ATP-binding protein [Desulfopila aestuarii DSM 18488]